MQSILLRSRAPALLLVVLLALVPATAGCDGVGGEGDANSQQSSVLEATQPEPGGGERTVESVLPEDVLSEEERTGAPEYEDWYAEGSEEPEKLVTSNSSVGAIPAVKPFNFGRDPGGPEDKTLYLTVPEIGLKDVPVFSSVSEEKLKESVVHVPSTGFPWQEGANTYIAGHRIGYSGTGSYRVFYDLEALATGDEILVRDAAGEEYLYRVTEQMVVGPDDVEVMEPVPGESVVSLQTCTLPDYAERIVVRGVLVEERA